MGFIEMVVHIRVQSGEKVLLVCSNPFRIIPMLVPSFAAVSGMCLKEGGGQRAKMNGANSVRSAVRPSAVKLSPFPLFPQKMKSLSLSLFLFPLLSHIEGQLGLDSWKLRARHQMRTDIN